MLLYGLGLFLAEEVAKRTFWQKVGDVFLGIAITVVILIIVLGVLNNVATKTADYKKKCGEDP